MISISGSRPLTFRSGSSEGSFTSSLHVTVSPRHLREAEFSGVLRSFVVNTLQRENLVR